MSKVPSFMKTVDLGGGWHFKAVNTYGTLPPEFRGVTRWMKATVPGTVHTDLLANRKIPDPFYRMNESRVQWIESQQWLYRRDFVVPPDVLSAQAIELVAGGLDTYATVILNGRRIGTAENMFIEHRFEIGKYLRGGKNRLEILFDSPAVRSQRLEKKHGPLEVSHGSERVYVRKAQYSFGWDWGPKLTTSGIWKKISIEACSGGRLFDPFVKVISTSAREAVLDVSVGLLRFTTEPFEVRAMIAGPSVTLEASRAAAGARVSFRVHIPHPELWWPNGYGSHPMYRVLFSLILRGREIHNIETPFAIRTVRLLQERDNEGKSFTVEINGVKIFCKGADWIPCDTFIPRIQESTYETLLIMARDAHMNMIRVWGGGFYENDLFYELCDRLGLMVWQDFMYACGEYPERAWFLKQAAVEAESVVKRLRNHPSIVLWCGNNECEWLFCASHPGKKPDQMRGSKIFREILKNTCRKQDGTRPYWRSSPFGSGFPNSGSNGNNHEWGVWSQWKDYRDYEKNTARFITEFGFQALPNRATIGAVTLPSDRDIQSQVMEHHNKQVAGTERLFRFQAAHYKIPDDFERWIYKSQLVQAEALKFAAEHWRRRKFQTSGSIFWQLNDCWPVSSWAVIDSGLRPKAAYYFAKRFFAPVLVSFKKVERGIELWATNDLPRPTSGILTLSLRSFSGADRWKRRFRIRIRANSTQKIYLIAASVYGASDPFSHHLRAALGGGSAGQSENRFFFADPKHLHLPRAKVVARVRKLKQGRIELTLQSGRFVKNVYLEVTGEDAVFNDNYFDLDAGLARRIIVHSRFGARELKRRLKLTWL
ncbi:MAG TPA: glycoside hydrolase family 2 protein [Bacteroidota bacterium]|nr:glycoside hydrolase family 2 protein [Bacteroidota bacterium]